MNTGEMKNMNKASKFTPTEVGKELRKVSNALIETEQSVDSLHNMLDYLQELTENLRLYTVQKQLRAV